MIHRTADAVNVIPWQSELARAIDSVSQLLAATGNSKSSLRNLDPGILDFPLRVPLPFVARMEPGNPNDPLLRQVLPVKAEQLKAPGFLHDPLDEASANCVPGVIHKYHGRVLLIVNSACAINCRYCFRRHFPYPENRNSTRDWQQALDYIRQDDSISEVIFSGGDPLLNNDNRLQQLINAIADIPHVARLRIHTRLPVVIPGRVTEALLDYLTATRLHTVMVLHCNHPNELDAEVGSAIKKLSARGIRLLNQSVLLKGVNDCADTLVQLSERLFNVGVLPYYLHLLDKVQGAAHFDVPQEGAEILLGELSARLPGYLVPKLAAEVPGAAAKTLILPKFV